MALGLVWPTFSADGQVLDALVRREVVDSIAAQVERVYVDADTARMIAARLRGQLRAGAYDTVVEPARFAQLLTADLRSVNHDLHLSEQYAPPGGAGGTRAPVAFADRSQHYALGRIDVLPGNVGYMEINGFSSDPAARDVIVSALRYLESTDAIILDLRRNRGGDASLVNLLVSHFTGPDTIASLSVKLRAEGRSFTRYTLASVPGPRRPDVPLYVLTSRSTGSAGEDFAFVLQNMKRATLIGDRTAGAGHNVTFVQSGHGMRTGISFSRVSDPRTGKEWEQVGVQPDIRADAATAVDVAHSLALQTIASRSTDPQRAQLGLIRETVEARLRPHEVPAAILAAYAGDYEGNRHVTVEGSRLLYQFQPGVPPEAAVALSDSVFALASQVRLVFELDERGNVRLRGVGPDGSALTFARVGATQPGVRPQHDTHPS